MYNLKLTILITLHKGRGILPGGTVMGAARQGLLSGDLHLNTKLLIKYTSQMSIKLMTSKGQQPS